MITRRHFMSTHAPTAVAAVIFQQLLRRAYSQDAGLFAQSASAVLELRFGDTNLSWLLLDRTGGMLAEHWPQAAAPIAPGSLLKPFVAVAYGEQHGSVYPDVQCTGTAGHCWYPHGHGVLGLEEALAQSCNAYFLTLADGLKSEPALRCFARLGLYGSSRVMRPADFIGLSGAWRETPLTLARAYLSLLDDRSNPARNRITAGMESAALNGTAREADAELGSYSVLAKTGTASCPHHPQATADGFALLLYPAEHPRFLLLVRQHATTGARTAGRAGAMLRAIGLGSR